MSVGGGGGGDLQQLSQELEALEEEIEALRTQIQTVGVEQTEVEDAIEAIERLETGSTVQVPIGGGATVRAEIADIDEILVDIGGGYAAESDQTEAIDLLESRLDQLEDREDELTDELAELETEQQELSQQAQQIQQQQMQQAGGMGAPPDGGDDS